MILYRLSFDRLSENSTCTIDILLCVVVLSLTVPAIYPQGEYIMLMVYSIQHTGAKYIRGVCSISFQPINILRIINVLYKSCWRITVIIAVMYIFFSSFCTHGSKKISKLYKYSSSLQLPPKDRRAYHLQRHCEIS